jgi:hypothetical protein
MPRMGHLVVVVALSLLLVGPVRAQKPPGPASAPSAPTTPAYMAPPPRDGLAYGVGIGVGGMSLDCDACEGAGGGAFFGFHVRGGWWLMPQRLAILADIGFSLLGTGDDVDSQDDEIQATFGGLAQYALGPRGWAGGGVALGVYDPPHAEERSGPVLFGAAGLAIGYLEGQIRVALGIYEEVRTMTFALFVGGGR